MNKVIIDVRESFEYKMGHVKGAINIPLDKIMNAKGLDSIGQNQKIVVYCRSGARSGMAKSFLERLGYSDVTNGINKSVVESRYL